MYNFLGLKNPIIDFDNLERLERDPDFRDRLTEEERRGIDRIRQVIATKTSEEPPK
jgi:hypothetical protein